jgi:hypothetical protein
MALRTKEIELEGKKITMKELSFAANLRLAVVSDAERVSAIYKEMMSEEDYKFLDEVGKKDFEKIRDAFDELTSSEVDPLKKKQVNGT